MRLKYQPDFVRQNKMFDTLQSEIGRFQVFSSFNPGRRHLSKQLNMALYTFYCGSFFFIRC